MHKLYAGGRARGAARSRVAVPRALALRRAEPARERHRQALRPRDRLAERSACRGAVAARPAAFALGPSIPLVLRGPAQVGSWSPSVLPGPDADLLERLAALYRGDALLGALLRRGARGAGDDGRRGQRPRHGRRPAARGRSWQRRPGDILGKRDGPRVASIDFGGWDTHINQVGEYSPLTRNLRLLDRSVAALKESLGPAWRHTAVLIVTEFGRTVAPERLERHRPRHGGRGVRGRRRGARRARDRGLARARRERAATRGATCARRSTCARSSRRRSPRSWGWTRRRWRRRCSREARACARSRACSPDRRAV